MNFPKIALLMHVLKYGTTNQAHNTSLETLAWSLHYVTQEMREMGADAFAFEVPPVERRPALLRVHIDDAVAELSEAKIALMLMDHPFTMLDTALNTCTKFLKLMELPDVP